MHNQVPWHSCEINRRELLRSAAIGAGCLCVGKYSFAEPTASHPLPSAGSFQQGISATELDFDESAAVTAEAGLDGIDCAVRAGARFCRSGRRTTCPGMLKCWPNMAVRCC